MFFWVLRTPVIILSLTLFALSSLCQGAGEGASTETSPHAASVVIPDPALQKAHGRLNTVYKDYQCLKDNCMKEWEAHQKLRMHLGEAEVIAPSIKSMIAAIADVSDPSKVPYTHLESILSDIIAIGKKRAHLDTAYLCLKTQNEDLMERLTARKSQEEKSQFNESSRTVLVASSSTTSGVGIGAGASVPASTTAFAAAAQAGASEASVTACPAESPKTQKVDYVSHAERECKKRGSTILVSTTASAWDRLSVIVVSTFNTLPEHMQSATFMENYRILLPIYRQSLLKTVIAELPLEFLHTYFSRFPGDQTREYELFMFQKFYSHMSHSASRQLLIKNFIAELPQEFLRTYFSVFPGDLTREHDLFYFQKFHQQMSDADQVRFATALWDMMDLPWKDYFLKKYPPAPQPRPVAAAQGAAAVATSPSASTSPAADGVVGVAVAAAPSSARTTESAAKVSAAASASGAAIADTGAASAPGHSSSLASASSISGPETSDDAEAELAKLFSPPSSTRDMPDSWDENDFFLARSRAAAPTPDHPSRTLSTASAEDLPA